MKNISLNIDKVTGFVSKEEILSLKPQVEAAQKALEEGTLPGNDFLTVEVFYEGVKPVGFLHIGEGQCRIVGCHDGSAQQACDHNQNQKQRDDFFHILVSFLLDCCVHLLGTFYQSVYGKTMRRISNFSVPSL